MTSISVDVAYEPNEDFPALMFNLEKKYNVKASVIKWAGPGGGWPFIKFEGEVENLQRLYLDSFDPGTGLDDFELDD